MVGASEEKRRVSSKRVGRSAVAFVCWRHVSQIHGGLWFSAARIKRCCCIHRIPPCSPADHRFPFAFNNLIFSIVVILYSIYSICTIRFLIMEFCKRIYCEAHLRANIAKCKRAYCFAVKKRKIIHTHGDETRNTFLLRAF